MLRNVIICWEMTKQIGVFMINRSTSWFSWRSWRSFFPNYEPASRLGTQITNCGKLSLTFQGLSRNSYLLMMLKTNYKTFALNIFPMFFYISFFDKACQGDAYPDSSVWHTWDHIHLCNRWTDDRIPALR